MKDFLSAKKNNFENVDVDFVKSFLLAKQDKKMSPLENGVDVRYVAGIIEASKHQDDAVVYQNNQSGFEKK